MDIKALFKIQCSLFVAGVESGGKVNGCISNTLMQQSHVPVKVSVTLDKTHLTHDLIVAKRSLTACILSEEVRVDTIRRFGFVSGRDTEKYADIEYEVDGNGNPYLATPEVAAVLSLDVYDTVDVGTHTLFLCTAADLKDLEGAAITYSAYQARLKKK